MRASRFLKTQRAKRRGNKFPVSAFSIFLLGFSLFYSVLHIFTLTTSYECRYGLIWISGWFEFASLFQIASFSISLLTLLFIARLLCFRATLNFAESVFQAALIVSLILVLIVHKAFLFPYGTPSWAQFEHVAEIVFRSDMRLEEEYYPIDLYPEWQYDYPPPSVEFKEDPRWSDTYNRRLSTIFRDKNSPLWSEFKELKQCDAAMVRAIGQWEEDQVTLEKYWKDFEKWYAVNRWQYDD